MSKYEVQLPPYAQTFLKSVVRSNATDNMLLVLRSRYGTELVYAASDAVDVVSGLRELADLAMLDYHTTKNLRERSQYEAARKGLLDAKSQAEKHLRRSLANRPA